MIITFYRAFFTSKRKNSKFRDVAVMVNFRACWWVSNRSNIHILLRVDASAAVNVRGGGQRAEMAGGMRRTRNVRSRIAAVQRERARQAATIQREAAEEDEREDDDEVADVGNFVDEEDEGLKAFSGKKVGTKKLRRLQEKAEKKAMREVSQVVECVEVLKSL